MSTSLTLVITLESDTWHHKILATQPVSLVDVENAVTLLVGASATGCVIKYLDQENRCLCTLDRGTLKNLPFVNGAVWHIFLFRDNETALFVPPVAEQATDEVISKATPQEAAMLRKNFESANNNNNNDDGNPNNNHNNNNNTAITNNVQAAPAAPEERRKRIERLVFGVARVLRRFSYISAKPVTTTATVFLSAVVEYLCAEILELAGTAATANGSARILPRHVASAIENDEELKRFFDSNNHSDLWYRSMFYGMFDYTSAEATFPASRVYRVLKQIHPGMEISSRAMNAMVNHLLWNVFERLAAAAERLSEDTVDAVAAQRAVWVLLPGRLALHAVSEGWSALGLK